MGVLSCRKISADYRAIQHKVDNQDIPAIQGPCRGRAYRDRAGGGHTGTVQGEGIQGPCRGRAYRDRAGGGHTGTVQGEGIQGPCRGRGRGL